MKHLAAVVWLALLTTAWHVACLSLKTAPRSSDGTISLAGHLDDVPKLVAQATDRLGEEVRSLSASSYETKDTREATLESTVPGAAVHTDVRQSLQRLQQALLSSGAGITQWVGADEQRMSAGADGRREEYRTQHEQALWARHSLDDFRNASRKRQAPFLLAFSKLEAEAKGLEASIKIRQHRLDIAKLAAKKQAAEQIAAEAAAKKKAEEKAAADIKTAAEGRAAAEAAAKNKAAAKAAADMVAAKKAAAEVAAKKKAEEKAAADIKTAAEAAAKNKAAAKAAADMVAAKKAAAEAAAKMEKAEEEIAEKAAAFEAAAKQEKAEETAAAHRNKGEAATAKVAHQPTAEKPIAADESRTRHNIEVDLKRFLAEPTPTDKHRPHRHQRSQEHLSPSAPAHKPAQAVKANSSDDGYVVLKLKPVSMSANLEEYLAHGDK